MCYNAEYKGFLILCEYMCRRRQQGVKRCEWVSGLDLVNLPIGGQVQARAVHEPVHSFQGQSLLASFMNESQDCVRFSHHAPPFFLDSL